MTLLTISSNRRYLVHSDGTPFFYLGDTAWELFHRLTREEADTYLERRAAQGFTVIQAVALAEFDGLTEPNAYGDFALIEQDPARPNPAYFKHVDYIVDRAAELGLVIGLLPAWGDKVNPKWAEKSISIFTPDSARAYGRFLGARYKDRPVIWIVGGDRPVDAPEHAEIWRAVAAGLQEGDSHRHLLTFHPMGGRSSSEFFHHDPWLAFNMLQSGHSHADIDNAAMIARDFVQLPTKPCMDAEPCYEDHPINWNPDQGWFDAWDVRKAAYNAVFAGAHGHTYGCHDIWQFYDPERHPAVAHARTPWREALDLPGAIQMRYLKELLLARPFLSRIPDQGLLADPHEATRARVRATRDSEGRYALVYSPAGEPVTVRLGGLAHGGRLQALWFDPRTGKSEPFETVAASGERIFTPPSAGPDCDWVLALYAE